MHEIFISYRRDTGSHLAALLLEKLTHLGYSAYLDVDAIPPGAAFPSHIRDGISFAKDVVVILTGNCLDSRNLPDGQIDWFWEEIRHAMSLGAHIVPLADEQYAVPTSQLPDDIKQFAFQNSTPYKSDLRSESIDRLTRHLRSVPSPSKPPDRAHKPNNLPYASLGTLFKGRDDTLARIHTLFDNHKGSAVAIYGLGGIGKTRIAAEYAHANRNRFTAILYVGADSPESIDTNIAGLCSSNVLDLPQQSETDAKRQCDAVKRWLRTKTDWLLIFDNADTKEAAQTVQNLASELQSSGYTLITSQLSNWPVHIKTLRIDELSVDDAVDYLLSATASQRRQTEGDKADATTLANVMGCLPLALSHAAAYIRRHTITFAQYLSRLEERHEAVLSWNDPRLTECPDSVRATWDTSSQQLSGEAKLLLQILSWFAPDPIPASIIEIDVPDVEGSPGIPSAMLEEALAELAGYSLVTQDYASPQFSVHRLVQDVTRFRMPEDVRDTTLGQALKWLDTVIVGALQDPKSWPRLSALAPHVENVSTNTLAQIVYPPTVSLLNRCAILFQYMGRFGAAEPLFRHAILLFGSRFGPSDPTVATATHNLAMVLYATGRFAEAENLYRSALFLYENCYGPGHPHVATALDNLANLLKTTNRPMEAEPLYQRSLAIREEFYGPDHPDVARSLNNYGGLLKTTNHLVEAEQMFTRGLAINARTFGDDDPSVATGLDNLAGVFSATNRAAEAEPMYRRAAAMREARYGPTHIAVANSLNSLGLLLTANNSLVEAEALFRRALEINEACYGPEHPEVAVGLNNLARILRRTGRVREAEPMYRRAMAIDEASYGPDHPEVATNLNNLGVLLREMGRHDEVEPLFARALEIRESSYGPNHPDVAQSLSNLASLLQATNRLAEAEPLYRRAIAIDEASYGPEHPDVATDLNNLAGLLQATNRLAEAEPLMRRSLSIRQHSYGQNHPAVANARASLAQLLLNLGRLAEAEEHSRQALSIWDSGENRDDLRKGKAHLVLGMIESQRGNTLAGATDLRDAIEFLSRNSATYAAEIEQARAELARLQQ